MAFSHVINISCYLLSVSYHFLMHNFPRLVLPLASLDTEMKLPRRFSSTGLDPGCSTYQMCDLGQFPQALCASVSSSIKCRCQYLPVSITLRTKWVNVFEAISTVLAMVKTMEVSVVIIADSRWCLCGCLPAHSPHLRELLSPTAPTVPSDVCIT